jgi:hypothetical protein
VVVNLQKIAAVLVLIFVAEETKKAPVEISTGAFFIRYLIHG